jgi:uncharacterized membrane protein
MPLPWLLQFSDEALLLMRLLVGVVFISSGWRHAKDPVTRAKSIGMSPGLTRFLGIAELAGGLGVAVGVLTQLAALGLIVIILGQGERWLALRPALRGHVSRHCHHRRRALRAVLESVAPADVRAS